MSQQINETQEPVSIETPEMWRPTAIKLARHLVQRASYLMSYTPRQRDLAAIEYFSGAAELAALASLPVHKGLWTWIRSELSPHGYAAVEQLAMWGAEEVEGKESGDDTGRHPKGCSAQVGPFRIGAGAQAGKRPDHSKRNRSAYAAE